MVDPEFPRGRASTPKVGRKTIISAILFKENCMQLNRIGPKGLASLEPLLRSATADQLGCESSADLSRIHHSARGHPDAVVFIQCNPEGYITHCQY